MVVAAAMHKLAVTSFLNNLAVLDNDYDIRIAYSGKTTGRFVFTSLYLLIFGIIDALILKKHGQDSRRERK